MPACTLLPIATGSRGTLCLASKTVVLPMFSHNVRAGPTAGISLSKFKSSKSSPQSATTTGDDDVFHATTIHKNKNGQVKGGTT
jgi:hypothetical protein